MKSKGYNVKYNLPKINFEDVPEYLKDGKEEFTYNFINNVLL